ncbi:MAG: UDP-N-acetylmuramoyl-L-alanyl-D-glutamate--2,6-diaminopimelate ligase, partial [Clostridia bacterium]|nr:UDP-N-acetylmuramoyl-L-alanyl-D-glutamate--2,6-diaminopimelate ligase [Clostridia bacterium]
MLFNVKADSRKVNKGDTFFALKTIMSDGHKFIPKAIENGATEIVCNKELCQEYNVNTDVPGVKFTFVEDCRKYLESYLVENFSQIFEKMRLLVVTGTNGKTTTAFLAYQAFNRLGIKSAYVGTIGFYAPQGKEGASGNTTPDLCDLYEDFVIAYNQGCEIFMVEGSSQGIVQGRMDTLKFDYAIFTNLTRDHLDFHKTMENYANAKLEVFKALKADGTAYLNIDDPWHKHFVLEENTNKFFGEAECDYQITNIQNSMKGTSFCLNGMAFESPLIGEYNVYNLSPIIAILLERGFSYEEIRQMVAELQNGEGRMETRHYKDNLIIVDYAHTPDGMEKIINAVREITPGKIYIVFGVRGNRDRGKRPEMMRIATENSAFAIVTMVHLYGEEFDHIAGDLTEGCQADNYQVIEDRGEAIKKGISLLDSQDTLLILGKGHE